MNENVMAFLRTFIFPRDIVGRGVLNVAYRNMSGPHREVIESLGPRFYVNVDVGSFPPDANRIAEHFGDEAFDVVIALDALERIKDWRGAFSNLKRTLRTGGLLILSVRSPGYPNAAHLDDHWRFTEKDIVRIFSDMDIKLVLPDQMQPGVFLKAVKVPSARPVDLSRVEVATA